MRIAHHVQCATNLVTGDSGGAGRQRWIFGSRYRQHSGRCMPLLLLHLQRRSRKLPHPRHFQHRIGHLQRLLGSRCTELPARMVIGTIHAGRSANPIFILSATPLTLLRALILDQLDHRGGRSATGRGRGCRRRLAT